MLGVLGKSTSADGKITRESLTRGGSQEDPQHLQRELQDSMERETDLKDQLKFAEEEVCLVVVRNTEPTLIFCPLNMKLRRLRDQSKPKRRSQLNRGTQTGDMLVLPLGFPRATQTPTIAHSDVSCNTQLPEIHEIQTVGSQTHEIQSCCNGTQTDCEPSSSSSRNLSRESSPFVSLFAPSTSTRVVNSTSLLFPSAISHVLLAGAGAGTKKNIFPFSRSDQQGPKCNRLLILTIFLKETFLKTFLKMVSQIENIICTLNRSTKILVNCGPC